LSAERTKAATAMSMRTHSCVSSTRTSIRLRLNLKTAPRALKKSWRMAPASGSRSSAAYIGWRMDRR
jgi:hypothetical protein